MGMFDVVLEFSYSERQMMVTRQLYSRLKLYIYILLVEFPHMLAQKMYGVCM